MGAIFSSDSKALRRIWIGPELALISVDRRDKWISPLTWTLDIVPAFIMTFTVSVKLALNPGSVEVAIVDWDNPPAVATEGESKGLLEVTDEVDDCRVMIGGAISFVAAPFD